MPNLRSYVFDDTNSTDKPCLLVLHGLFGEANNWRQLAQQWGRQFRVITLDLRNHGQSFTSPSMAYQDLAKDVLDSMDQLGLAKAHILGHSMGGKVAMQVALIASERLQSLMVADIAPVTYALGRHDDIFAALYAVDLDKITSRKQALDILLQTIDDHRIGQFLAKSLYKVSASKQQQGQGQGFAWRFNLDALKNDYANICAAPIKVTNTPFLQPVLIIKGALSDYVQTQHRPAFSALFPQAKVKIIPNAGHWLHAEKPDQFARIVTQFIAEFN